MRFEIRTADQLDLFGADFLLTVTNDIKTDHDISLPPEVSHFPLHRDELRALLVEAADALAKPDADAEPETWPGTH